MKKFARGRAALSFLALILGITYFQPRVGEAFNIAGDGGNAIVQENQKTQIIQTEISEISEKIENSISTNTINSTNEKAADLGKKVLAGAFRATAYCLKGKTAVGGAVRRGIVAADPRILPLGTRIFINAGAYSGSYIVADTGGAVRGKILDVWVPTCSEAVRFGRKSVTVSILGR
ncbi:MAG: 3D domain-containing protein [Pyrinomonadaceae bacterium]